MNRLQLAWTALWKGTEAVSVIPTWQVGQSLSLPTSYTAMASDGYKRNEIVFACIRYRAQAYTEPALKVMLGDKDAPDNHPLVQLLNRPYAPAKISLSRLLESRSIMLDIGGVAYWEKIRARNGTVVGLSPIRPDRIEVIPDRDGVAAYKYKVGDYVHYFEPADVIQFTYYDPLSDFFGLSPLQVCARAADADNERADYIRLFFRNAAVPYGLLKTKVKIDQAEKDRIQRRWQEQYAGMDNWHNVAVLDADAEYQRLGLTQGEMSFPDLTSLSESRICMSFRVPPILVGTQIGLDRATYANYKEARSAFWEDTMVPSLRQFEDVLNMELAAEFDAEIVIDTSQIKALQEDRDGIFTRVTAAVNSGWLLVNEGREEAGFEEVKRGDVFLRQMTQLEVSPDGELDEPKPVVAPAPGLTEEADDQSDDVEDEQDEQDDDMGVDGKALAPDEVKFTRRVDQIARAHELEFNKAARDLFREEQRAILSGLPKGRMKAGWVNAFWLSMMESLNGSRPRWSSRFMPLFAGVFAEQGEAIEAQFGLSFDIHNPQVQEFLDNYSFKFAEKIGSTTVEKLRELIERAEAEAWGIPELQRQLGDLYDEWVDLRAEMIARSETIRSANAGAREGYRLSGVQRLRWWTAQDERTCPWCMSMHGRDVGIQESFWKLGDSMILDDGQAMQFNYEAVEHPPLHVFCRCVILPILS